jgi:RNA polymerase sigma factor (sigma-70 family)
MHQHVASEYLHAVHADRAAAASARRRAPADGPELERLVAAAAAGEPMAWEALVHRYGPRLLRIARSHGLTRAAAEAAVQDTWMRLLRSIGSVRDAAAIGGWLRTTAGRESLRVRERARRERATDEPLGTEADDTAQAGDGIDTAACQAAVNRALAGLPVRSRALLRMLFADAAPSYGEIAAQLDMPVGSIGPTRGRCLAQLRRDGGLRRLAEQLD